MLMNLETWLTIKVEIFDPYLNILAAKILPKFSNHILRQIAIF